MKNNIRFALTFFIIFTPCFWLTGCTTTMNVKYGTDKLTEENLSKIQKGTPLAEVKSLLGDPLSETVGPTGKMWTYTYSEQQRKMQMITGANSVSGFARSVVIVFAPDDTVENISKSTTNTFQPVTVQVS